MQFINLMCNKLKPKEVANALDANTSAVADINALIGSTPLPQGETITHMLSNFGGGVNYSTDEQYTGVKWVNGKNIYQKTVVADVTESEQSILSLTGVDSVIDFYGTLYSYDFNQWYGDKNINFDNYWANTLVDNNAVQVRKGNFTRLGAKITILYTKN